MLAEIITRVRQKVGADFLLGVRLAAEDYNYLPLQNIRLPLVFPLKHFFFGHTLDITLDYGKRLKALGVDFLHIVSGYGFISPRLTPGRFPFEELKIFFDARGTSSFAYDGTGTVKRDHNNYAISKFKTGKIYSADLSASYNIAARHIAYKLKLATKRGKL